jgi:hypothetical protein
MRQSNQMKKRDRLNKFEDIGFYIVMVFASLVIGFGIIALIAGIMKF